MILLPFPFLESLQLSLRIDAAGAQRIFCTTELQLQTQENQERVAVAGDIVVVLSGTVSANLD